VYYNLTLYEFLLYSQREKKRTKNNTASVENGWAQTRIMWALIANVNRDTKLKPTPWLPTDLIRLSFDDDIERISHDVHPPSAELMNKLKQRFGSKIKPKNV
jgi:hypothetical protein